VNFKHILAISTLLTLTFIVTAIAAPSDLLTRKIGRGQDQLIFPNSKGEVIFSHSRHLQSLQKDQCILCHRVDNPTLASIQSRLENHRVAHYFCKGCHHDMGKGPTECHQCHNYKKTT